MSRVYLLREKERDRLSPTTKAPTPTKISKNKRDSTKNSTKNFDYITIADRPRTVSWGNDSHPTGVAKPVHGIPTLPLIAKAVQSKTHRLNYLSLVNFCYVHVAFCLFMYVRFIYETEMHLFRFLTH